MPAETPADTFNLLRLGNKKMTTPAIVCHIHFYSGIVNAIFNLICWLISPTTFTVEAFKRSILVNLISIFELIILVVSGVAAKSE